jgi:hypothetical protein
MGWECTAVLLLAFVLVCMTHKLVCIGARSYWVLENDDWSSGNLLQLGQCSSHVL